MITVSNPGTPMSDTLRVPWKTTSAIAQTMPRNLAVSNINPLASGRLELFGGAVVPAGKTVSSISFACGGTAIGTPTNQWFALYDSARVLLGVTADDTSTAWAVNTVKTLTLATPYTATADTPVLLGVCCVAAIVPTLYGTSTFATALSALAPVLAMSGNNTLTNPASAPATATNAATQTAFAWAQVS